MSRPIATDFKPGDRAIADRPSPLAAIKNGRVYVVERVEMADATGYVFVVGDPLPYRPYLFRPKP